MSFAEIPTTPQPNRFGTLDADLARRAFESEQWDDNASGVYVNDLIGGTVPIPIDDYINWDLVIQTPVPARIQVDAFGAIVGDFSGGGVIVEPRVAVVPGTVAPASTSDYTLLPYYQTVASTAGNSAIPFSFCYVKDIEAGLWVVAVRIVNSPSSLTDIDFNYGQLSVRRGRAKQAGP